MNSGKERKKAGKGNEIKLEAKTQTRKKNETKT